MTTDDALYQPLPHLDRDIRLIAILPAPNGDINDPVECTIRPVNPKDPETSFHALSYTWGDPGVTIPITLNGVSVNVTTNLDSALRHLRAKYSVEIWIDALSINQKDPKEKKKQIPLMGDIYSLAAHVIVWLGPEDDDAGAAMEHIENWYAALDKHRISDTADKFDMFSVVEELEDPFDEDKFAAVTSLLKRPWWFRKWIIQEVFMAKEITLLIGMHVFSWHHFKTVVTCWDDDDLKSSGAAPWNFFRIRGDDFTVFGTLEALCHLKNTNGLTQDFLEVAKLHQSSLCGDPRDRIYALMSLASDASDLIIPSSTPNPHASSVFTGPGALAAGVGIDNFATEIEEHLKIWLLEALGGQAHYTVWRLTRGETPWGENDNDTLLGFRKYLLGDDFEWPVDRKYDNSIHFGNFVRAMQACARDKGLVGTTRGYLGLVPPEAEEGDLVCVLLGCPVPLVLRRVDDGYVVLGSCVAQGIMDGEFMEEVERGGWALETFLLR
ncbi:hypothetical protein OQA88_12144 [Cercophora sp. LCS_1]